MSEPETYPVDEDGNRIDEPLNYNGWLLYPDGRIEHESHDTVVEPDGTLNPAGIKIPTVTSDPEPGEGNFWIRKDK